MFWQSFFSNTPVKDGTHFPQSHMFKIIHIEKKRLLLLCDKVLL